MSFCKFTDNSGNTYFLSAGQWIQPPDPGEYFEAIEILARIEHSELFRAEHSLFFQLDADFKQRLTRRLGRDWQNVEPTSSVLHPGASIQSSSTALPGRWPIILDAIYHGDIRLTKLAASPKTSKTSAAPVEDNRALLRVKIRQALAAIVTQEKVEAAQHTRMLGQESRAGRATIYTGAFFTGLWNAGTDFAQWLKEVNDVLNPLQRSLRGIRAGHSALQRNSKTGENLLAAYQDEVLTAEKRELVQVLGFDPSQLSREQFQQAIELADLIWEDPALQGDLRRFAKDYVQAQHPIELTEFSGAAAFEVLFTILLAAITGGAGLAASAAGLTRHFARFRKVGDLLIAFGEEVRKIRLAHSRGTIVNRKTGFENFETLGDVEVSSVKGFESSTRKGKPGRKTGTPTEQKNSPSYEAFEGELDASLGKIPKSDYAAIKSRSVHNLDSDTLILGKYRPTITNGVEDWSIPGPDSYVAIARTEHATYFDLGGEWGEITSNYNLTDDDMFKAFNIPVLDDAVSAGKTIKFTHDPRTQGGFLQQEWEYLQETHGFKRLKEIDGVWHAK